MHEPNVLHSSSEPSLEQATTIPPAPAASLIQPTAESSIPSAPSLAAPPASSSVQRSGRLSRLLLLRSLRAMTLLGRALWPYRLSLGLSLVFILVIGWMGTQLWVPSVKSPSFRRVDSIAPAPAVESFIEGQQNYNGELMWESLSEQVKAQLLSRGDSKATWQARAEMDKRSGQIYRRYDYVGGVRLQDGGGMFFYLVDVESPRPDRNGPMSYVFTVDTDGKILSIE